jgi:hypothetical protein
MRSQTGNVFRTGMRLNRRETLGYLAAGGLVTSPLLRAGAALADQTGTHPDLSDPDQLLTAFMRLSGSLDDRLIIWWMSGRRYGVVGASAQLMYGMEVGMFHRFFRQADGSFKVAMFELTYYTDSDTGQLLKTYQNPYTKEENTVAHVRLGPELRRQTASGIARPANRMVREFASTLGPATIRDNNVWIPIDVEATIRFPKPQAPEIILNHYTTVHGKLSEATDPDKVSVPANLTFQNILKWEPWMRMGDHPGHMMSRAAGLKLESLDELPDNYLAMAEQVHPKLIADPIATLEKLTQKIS